MALIVFMLAVLVLLLAAPAACFRAPTSTATCLTQGSAISSWRDGMSSSRLSMSLEGKVGFLLDKSQEAYISSILRRARDSLDLSAILLSEIEFPVTRNSDLSVVETLDRTRAFTYEFIKDPRLSALQKELWVAFPDSKECGLARDKWGAELPFTLTSIAGALTDAAKQQPVPRAIICPSPGFNIPEWLDIEKIHMRYPTTPIVIINGNLDRLRNGYYPWFFYPELTRVTARFYRRFEQLFYCAPIAVSGDVYGSWSVRVSGGPWEIFVKSAQGLALVSSTTEELGGQEAWKIANAAYKRQSGRMF